MLDESPSASGGLSSRRELPGPSARDSIGSGTSEGREDNVPSVQRRYGRRDFISRGTSAGAGMFVLGNILAACGGGKKSSSPGKLTFLNYATGDKTRAAFAAALLANAAAYKKQAGVAVAFKPAPFDTYATVQTTLCRAGRMGDITLELPGMNDKTIFSCLKPLNENDLGDLSHELSAWSSALIDLKSPSSGYFGIPMGAQGTLLYYNKRLFKRAGLDPDHAPSSWDEFKAACAALKRAGIDPIGMSGSDSYTPWWLWNCLSMQYLPTSADAIKVGTGEIKLNDARLAEPLQLVAETYKRGWWSSGWQNKSFLQIQSDFTDGKIGIVPGVMSAIMNWQVFDQAMGKSAYGVMPPLQITGAPAAPPVQFSNSTIVVAMVQDSPQAKQARAFVNFLAGVEGQTTFLKKAGQFPNRTDVDVARVTGSAGAAAILDIVRRYPGAPSAMVYFNAGAMTTALQQLSSAISSSKLSSYLNNLTAQQAHEA